jgi:hypothetical protein
MLACCEECVVSVSLSGQAGGDAWVRSERRDPLVRWDTKPDKMFGRPSSPLNLEREKPQPESVSEHCETCNDALFARLSDLLKRKEEAHAPICFCTTLRSMGCP